VEETRGEWRCSGGQETLENLRSRSEYQNRLSDQRRRSEEKKIEEKAFGRKKNRGEFF
jgi:hypothetical protein